MQQLPPNGLQLHEWRINNTNLNKMIKPIFLVGLPKGASIEQIEQSQKSLESKLDGYYALVYSTNETEIQFKCFFEKDFDNIKFDELKQIVKEGLVIEPDR